MDDTLNEKRDEFMQIVKEKIERDGIDKLVDYLQKSDYFTAPASKNNHSDFEGGLLVHSLNVYKRLRKCVLDEYGGFDKISEESIAICGLFHDLCKVDYYVTEMRNVKENGVWVQKPYYKVEEKLPYGHGEKSVYILSGFIKLSRDEALAINWHMGGFDHRVQGGNMTSVGECYRRWPLAFWLHIADMQATYIDENSLNMQDKNA